MRFGRRARARGRAIAIGIACLALGGCGLILDADPPDPARDRGDDGGVGADAGVGRSDAGGGGDGGPDGGPTRDASPADAGTGCGFPPRRLDTAARGSKVDIAWSGRELAVVWDDRRAGPSAPEIYFASVTEDGVPVAGETPLTALRDARAPSIAWDGTSFGVAWTGSGSTFSAGTVIATFAPDGTPVLAPVVVSEPAGQEAHADLAWIVEARAYFVAWDDARAGPASDIYLRAMLADGTVLGDEIPVRVGAATSEYPAIVWDGGRIGVAFRELDVAAAAPSVWLARLAADASRVLEAFRLDAKRPAALETEPGAAAAGGTVGVVYQSFDDAVVLARVGTAPSALLSAVTTGELAADDPAIASAGDRFLHVWEDDRDPADTDLYYAETTPDGAPLVPNIPLARTVPESDTPAVVWTGRGVAVAWEEGPDPDAEIWLAYWCPRP